jgi:cytoskeletal protein RodZ
MISDVTKRVEREIAEATKNHEIKIQKEDESKSEKSMAIKKRRAEIKANLYQPLKSHQILKMARIVVIILLAFFTGYKFATSGTQSIVAATRKLRDSAGISSTSIFRDLRTATSIKEGYNSMHVFLLPRYHKDSTNQWGGLLKRLNLQLQETGQYENEFEAFKIGLLLQEMRKEKGLTQEQLAEKTGTKKSYISRIENGRGNIQL